MADPAHGDGHQVGNSHYAAIWKEIGEQIWERQERAPVRLPAHLVGLTVRLRNSRPLISAQPAA